MTVSPTSIPRILRPQSVAEVCSLVREYRRVIVRGAGSKPRLSVAGSGDALLEMGALRAIMDYDPGEYTFTALAGTPVAEVSAALAGQGQYLPFDPMLGQYGTTLGGMVAAGLNGPGRWRYGGMRDFIIGVQFVDGRGVDARGGGKVVKNAAGFDFPKLLVGSLGRLAVITEVTFKVFPRPEASLTATADLGTLPAALATLAKLAKQPFDLDALDLRPPSMILLRISGSESALRSRLERIRTATQTDWSSMTDAGSFWEGIISWRFTPVGCWRVKVPLVPRQIQALEAEFEPLGVRRHYSVAGNVAFLAWPAALGEDALDQLLKRRGLGALILDGEGARVLWGHQADTSAQQLVKNALDPNGTFGSLA